MATFYLKSGAGAAQFAQSTAYVQGDKIVPKRTDTAGQYLAGRKWVWECTTAGTSAAAEPTWVSSVTQDVTTITSGTATFTARKPGFSSGTTADWTFATIFLDYAITAPTAVGDIVYVSNNHAESIAAAITPAANVAGVSVLCVDDGAAPPTTSATTATVTTTGNSNITLGTAAREYFYGITFTSGSSASGTASIIPTATVCDSCNLVIGSTGVSSVIGGAPAQYVNCGFKFGAAAQGISIGTNGQVSILGGSLLSGGTSPTALVTTCNSGLYVDGMDLSNASATVNLCSAAGIGTARFVNMKLPTSWSGSVNSATVSNLNVAFSIFNCDNSATNYVLSSKTWRGLTSQEATVVKSGGFSVAGTPISWKLVSLSGAGPAGCYINSHFTPELAAYNSTTGSAITVTVDFIHDSLTNLQNNEIWLEVTYLGTSGAPLGTYASSRPATPMTAASDLAASSATWTTTGLTNPNEQKLTVTFTPQLAGMIIGRVKLCKASATVYVDPVLQIS